MITVETLQNLNYILAIGGLFGIATIAFLIVDMFKGRVVEKYILQWGGWLMFLLLFASVALTQVYSGLFGIIPCGFCWFERIFLYPQFLIVLVGIYIKDALMPYYVITLSAFGFVISLYHHYIQMGGSQFVTCPTAGAGADCAKRFMFEFGFVTFPLLAAIAFIFLAVVAFYMLRARSNLSRLEGSLSEQD